MEKDERDDDYLKDLRGNNLDEREEEAMIEDSDEDAIFARAFKKNCSVCCVFLRLLSPKL
ncbi:hypothetical protein LguiA_023382 [Lonicera macranthoides]